MKFKFSPFLLRTTLALCCVLALAGCASVRNEQADTGRKLWRRDLSGNITFHFLDVGQGDCTLVVFPDGRRLLVDCGTSGGNFDAARVRRKIRSLLDPASPKVDLLVITHPDADHYNRLPEVLGPANAPAIPVLKVLYTGTPSEYPDQGASSWLGGFPASRRVSIADQSYNTAPARPLPGFEGAGAVILAANVPATASAKNARSIVLKISHGDFDVMLAGDATSATDSRILQLYPGSRRSYLDVEVWKAAHHGSWATATHSGAWAAAVRPEAVVYSASSTNRYGHPNIRLAERFAPYTQPAADHPIAFFDAQGSESSAAAIRPYRTEAMYLTATSGDIAISSDGRTWTASLSRP